MIVARSLRGLLGLVLCYVASNAAAGDVQTLTIDNNDGTYTIHTEVIIDAPVDAVRSVLTNYAELHRLNNSVKKIEILNTDPGFGVTRIRSEVHVCALFFCMELQQVQDMVDVKPGDLRAFILAEHSDFAAGKSFWKTREAPGQEGATLMVWDAELTPDFWIPPAIGPWIIENKLEEEALETIDNIEAIIREDHDSNTLLQ